MTRPLASISFDADNLWSYMKTHGDATWQAYPSYL
ncbi:MAG: polysaccharide deacetylase, partial [Gemmatimonadota bacterium]